ncbi:hypothetical protein [Nonomuraea deserti]|uniref:hypothetical protein n=1 Tax=Nonomuraea deserti TaxID=1848322 RepID=UPI001C70A138|nr:hypothetical protein [Nonomuraea deserti]
MLGDPIVRQALERIHQDPARPWTTATLASALAVSRATLSRRFPAAIGQSPAATPGPLPRRGPQADARPILTPWKSALPSTYMSGFENQGGADNGE